MKKKEIKATFILLVSFILFILIFSVFVRNIDLNTRKGIVYFAIFLVYMILSFALSKVAQKNKLTEISHLVFSFPMAVIYLVLQFSAPFMAIIMNLIIYILLSAAPIVIIFVINNLNIIDISREKQIFLLLTITTIMAVTFNKYIVKFIVKRSPAIRDESKKQAVKTIELTQYLFKRNNIRFVIYLLYFGFLIFYTLSSLSENESLVNFAVLQAFLVFLAYDSIIINSKEISILPSIILKKVLNIFTSDVQEEIEEQVEEERHERTNV